MKNNFQKNLLMITLGFVLLFPASVGAFYNDPCCPPVGNDPPSGTLLVSPTTVYVGETITITVDGEDADGLSSLRAYYKGRWHRQSVSRAVTASRTWNLTEQSPGIYRYCGKVTGYRGHSWYQGLDTVYTSPACVDVEVTGYTPSPPPPPPSPSFSVSCYASPSSARKNQTVTFYSSVSGGTGDYDYSWSGACRGSSSRCRESFSRTGRYTATVRVTSGDQRESASCSVRITTPTPQCVCGSWSNWIDRGCGLAACGSSQMYQARTRTCAPAGCSLEIESRCVTSAICTVPVYTPTYTGYTKYFRKACYDNDLYWFDSNGLRQEKYRECSDENECTLDSCQNGACLNELKCDGTACEIDSEDYCESCEHCGDGICNCQETISTCSEDCKTACLTVSILAKKEKESIQWVKNLEIRPEEEVDFLMVIANGGAETIKDAIVKAEIPGEIAYQGDLKIDGASSSGDIKAGINIGSLASDTVKTITFKGRVLSGYAQEGEKEIIGIVIGRDFSDSDSVKIAFKPSRGFAAVGIAAIKFFIRQWYFWILVIAALIFLFFFVFRKLFSVAPG